MEFFKRKSMLAIAALFAASALFTGCSSNPDDDDDDAEAQQFVISFDTQGGNDISDIKAGKGKQITLPVPVREEDVFKGWFSAAEGGTKYNSPYTVTGNVTMYAQWIYGEDVADFLSLNGGWLDPSLSFALKDGVMACGGWYYHYEYGEITNVQIKEGELSWHVELELEDEDEDIWPYASMVAAIDVDVLTDDFEITLTYTAGRAIQLVLSDTYVFDSGEEAGHEGVCFAASLNASPTTPRTVTLTKADFKQPSWAAGDGLGYTLDVKLVEGFAIDAGDNYGRNFDIKITEFKVSGLDWGE